MFRQKSLDLICGRYSIVKKSLISAIPYDLNDKEKIETELPICTLLHFCHEINKNHHSDEKSWSSLGLYRKNNLQESYFCRFLFCFCNIFHYLMCSSSSKDYFGHFNYPRPSMVGHHHFGLRESWTICLSLDDDGDGELRSIPR